MCDASRSPRATPSEELIAIHRAADAPSGAAIQPPLGAFRRSLAKRVRATARTFEREATHGVVITRFNRVEETRSDAPLHSSEVARQSDARARHGGPCSSVARRVSVTRRIRETERRRASVVSIVSHASGGLARRAREEHLHASLRRSKEARRALRRPLRQLLPRWWPVRRSLGRFATP